LLLSEKHRQEKLVEEFKIVFWDFDGVIKDSVSVKTLGYEKLFSPFGKEVVERVTCHHKMNGGVSRFEKIPLYLSWAGQPSNTDKVQEYCEQFSKLVQQAVINSPWVPGVYEYLSSHNVVQCFILITGTPQDEIEQILEALEIAQYFREVHGAPKNKANVVNEVLIRLDYSPKQALIIGDSNTDLEAAEENNVAFLLRQTPFNKELQKQFQGPSMEGLHVKDN
jgi:phosphoglycolate phosphatase-like HAD superfamily hydrolase